MKTQTRPKHRETRRFLNGVNLYHDKARCRFVVYRRAYGVTRKSSVRYFDSKTEKRAQAEARDIASRLRLWPAEKLEKFRFHE